MDQQRYIITFENGSVADANRWANELKETILDAPTSDVEVEQQRDNLYSLDFGATLLLVLGTPAIMVVAKAVGNWLQRRQSASLTFKRPEGDVIATGINNKTVVKLTELLLKNPKE
jgi:hypothetical protein